jgi:hypothetical protein
VGAGLVLGIAGLVLVALFWLVRPRVGFTWLAFGLLPTILGFGCLALAGWSIDRLRRQGLREGRSATASLVVGVAAVVLGAPSFLLTLWVLVLVLVGGNA